MPRTVLLLVAACCAASASEREAGWYEEHMDKVAVWAVDACEHILTARSTKAPFCESFVSEHGAEIMSARSKALGDQVEGKAVHELCGEVAHILSALGDDEVVHLASKSPYKEFCKKRFSLESEANDYFAELKHYFVLGKRRHKQEL